VNTLCTPVTTFKLCEVVDIELPLHWRSICLLEEWWGWAD